MKSSRGIYLVGVLSAAYSLPTIKYAATTGQLWSGEPRRVSRRLQTLRGWGHAETNEVFPGSAIARRADGRRARGRARVAVGGDHLDRRADRLYRRDAPEVGAPSRA